jgi:hypothetical protein
VCPPSFTFDTKRKEKKAFFLFIYTERGQDLFFPPYNRDNTTQEGIKKKLYNNRNQAQLHFSFILLDFYSILAPPAGERNFFVHQMTDNKQYIGA